MAFKMKGSPIKLGNIATKSALKHSGKEYAAENVEIHKGRRYEVNEKTQKAHDKAHSDGIVDENHNPVEKKSGGPKMKSPMKDRYEEVRHLGNPEGGAMWHEDKTPHSDRTITAEEEAAIEKRRAEERAAEIAENQKKLDASRVVIPTEGVGGQLTKSTPVEEEKKKSAGSHEAFLDYERQVNQWIEEGMDPEEAIARAQKIMDRRMNKELALEKASEIGNAANRAVNND